MAQPPSFYREQIQRLHLLDAVEAADGEMTQEVQELFTFNQTNVEEKTRRLLELIDQNKQLIAGSKQVIEEEKARLEKFQRTQELLEKQLQEGIETFGEMQVGTRRVSITQHAATDILAPEELPEEYVKVVPESRVPDRSKILTALRKGIDVWGAALKFNKKLSIK